MTEALPPDVRDFVHQQVATGHYQSEAEVIAAGVRVLQELEQRRDQLRKEIQAGVDELDRGEGIELAADELRSFFDDVQARGRARYEASRQVR